MNAQKPEGKAYREDGQLWVHSIFNTLQGEGPFCGWPATFVRLAGCNLQCAWCDTEYTTRELMPVSSIAHKCMSSLVVVTGGEPLRQNIVPLVRALAYRGRIVQIETNGTIFDEELDKLGPVFVVSPKTRSIDKRFLPWYHKCNSMVYLKQVFGPAFPSQPHDKGGQFVYPPGFEPDYIMPLETDNEETDKVIRNNAAKYCIEKQIKLSIRLHKLVNIQ